MTKENYWCQQESPYTLEKTKKKKKKGETNIPL